MYTAYLNCAEVAGLDYEKYATNFRPSYLPLESKTMVLTAARLAEIREEGA